MTAPTMLDMTALRQRVLVNREKHAKDVRTDSRMYNGGTFVVLLFTSAAAFLDPAWLGNVPWIPRALAAFAAVLVGLERALSFGGRWRFHLDLRAGYDTVLDMIDFLQYVPQQERDAHIKTTWEALKVVRGRESSIPTGGGAPNNSSPLPSPPER